MWGHTAKERINVKTNQSLNAEQRKERARNAAKARWAKDTERVGFTPTDETKLKRLQSWAHNMGYKLVPLGDADQKTA